MTKYTLGR